VTPKINAGFTQAAIAGLAAKEDFSNVKLKRSDSTSHIGEYPPYNDVMLMQIKGMIPTQEALFSLMYIQVYIRSTLLPNTPSRAVYRIAEQ
jgi:hypothetical protein